MWSTFVMQLHGSRRAPRGSGIPRAASVARESAARELMCFCTLSIDESATQPLPRIGSITINYSSRLPWHTLTLSLSLFFSNWTWVSSYTPFRNYDGLVWRNQDVISCTRVHSTWMDNLVVRLVSSWRRIANLKPGWVPGNASIAL